MRDEVLTKLRRHAINPISCRHPDPDNGENDPNLDDTSSIELAEYLAKTVIDQAHLCPLPLSVQPVYWSHDTALQLFPLPTVVRLYVSVDG